MVKAKIKPSSDPENLLAYARPVGFLAPTHDSPGFSCYIANASDDWRKAVERHLELIPPVIRTILSTQDIKIVLAGRPTDIGYTSEAPDPDDYYGRSEVETAAFYTSAFKAVVLPEFHRSQKSKQWIPLYQQDLVVVHEVTHALDDVLQISAQPEAQDAYAIDKNALTSCDRYYASIVKDKYGYLLQEGRRGEKEAVAEQGSFIWAGNTVCGLQEYDWHFLNAYSKAYMTYITEHYDPAKGLSQTFSRAAAHHAENALLQEVIIKDNTGYNLMFDMASRMRRTAADDYYPTDRTKTMCIRNMLQRQGQDAVEAAYLEYRERMKALRFEFRGF